MVCSCDYFFSVYLTLNSKNPWHKHGYMIRMVEQKQKIIIKIVFLNEYNSNYYNLGL